MNLIENTNSTELLAINVKNEGSDVSVIYLSLLVQRVEIVIVLVR